MAKFIVTVEFDFGEEKDFDYVHQTANAFIECDYQWNDLVDEVRGYSIKSFTVVEENK